MLDEVMIKIQQLEEQAEEISYKMVEAEGNTLRKLENELERIEDKIYNLTYEKDSLNEIMEYKEYES